MVALYEALNFLLTCKLCQFGGGSSQMSRWEYNPGDGSDTYILVHQAGLAYSTVSKNDDLHLD